MGVQKQNGFWDVVLKQINDKLTKMLEKLNTEYIKTPNGEIYLTHTEVPRALGGKGIGSQLVEKALKDIEQKDLRLVPLCPFVAGYIHKHPEWRRIVMKGFHIQ